MRFDGEREVGAPVAQVWRMLHDRAVLRTVLPGCVEMTALGPGAYAAILQARCGRLDVALRVALAGGARPRTTALRYAADASVGGLASRLGAAALTVAGHHFTCGFFDDLEQAVRRGAAIGTTADARQPA